MSTLNDIREKKTPLQVGENAYNLFYDLNAFAELEEIYGSVEKAMSILAGGSVKAIINILWAGLIHENETLTQKEVGKMFDLSQMPEIGSLINEAINRAIPQSSEPAGAKTDTKKK